jgi:hypothetical protein
MQTTEPGGDKPANHLFAYTVQEYEAADGKKARSWTRIGVAFPHKDGTGFNIDLHALPLDGRIVLFPPNSDERAEEPAIDAPPPPPPQVRSTGSRRR